MMPGKDEATVFVVDDSPQMHASIAQHLQAARMRSEFFPSGEEFLKKYDPSRPGCLVLDEGMKGMNGLELQRQLLERDIPIPVVMVSAFADVRCAVSAIRAGAVDFLEKPIQEGAFLRAVREGIERDRERRLDESRLASLTSRERQILGLLVAGENYKEIASRLEVSPKTVEGHRVNLLRKLGLRSVIEAVRWVFERHGS
jgi:FixJ family two-component response regulator